MAPVTWAWFIALLGWTALLSFYQLDGGGGLEPVDAWVAQPAREMYENTAAMFANRGEAGWQWRPLVIPQFCGETRLQKSPGAYWAVALTAYLRGEPVDEVSARIPNATFAVLFVITVFWLARRIAGDRAAIFAGFAAASSAAVLHWSHSAASDMGVATLCAMSLACLWVGSESEPAGWKRYALWLLGYFFAGLAMLYKMPLPLVCVGLPAFLYVLLRNRWRIFASWWHLLGLALFLLPWLPWALAVWHFEPMAIYKWRAEYFDRVTGDLPNVNDQKAWFWYLFYVGVALLLAIPYSLSVPAALARAFRRQQNVNRDGTLFALIWFVSLLVFLTVAVGKETRYFLPAMPPLFILLGVELAAFFDPDRPVRRRLGKLGFWAVCTLVPAALVGLAYVVYRELWQQHISRGIATWGEVWQPYAVAAVIFAAGAILAASLYVRRRENASFAALAGTMWLAWLWVWPYLMPVVSSQAPFKDFAAQLATLSPEHKACLRQVAQQDPRIIWYSDVRFPRIIDQLKLLEMVGGKRDLERETLILGEEMVRQLQGNQLILFVSTPRHYILFHTAARELLALEGKRAPDTHIWRMATKGRLDRRYLLYGNQPPPWEEPELPVELQRAIETPPKGIQRVIDRLVARKRAELQETRASIASGPSTRPASATEGTNHE
jgi:4-amino-4-deoxy-L-arabinose transferase-like glycosyltransferase